MEEARIKGIKMTRVSGEWQSLIARVIVACIMTLLFRVVLDIMYVYYISRFYAGDFPLNANSLHRMIESYAIALMLTILIVSSLYHRWRPSGIVLVLYFVVVMLPLSSLYGLADAHAAFVYAAAGCFAVLIAVTEILPKIRLPRPGRDLVYLGMTAVSGISAYVYGWLALTGGLERLSFDLLSVYEVRAEYVQTLGPYMGYFVPWQAYVINIFVLCYALERRNYLLLCLTAIMQLLLFGMTGHKSFFLALLLVCGVYIVWQRKNAISFIILGASLLTLASYAYFLISGNEFVSSILIRRLFFVPASLHVIYYDFFSQPEHPFYMLSDSILRPFIQNPYGISMPKVIAFTYWDKDFWPDVGYLGDAYGNFGFLGMLIFSIILGVVLRIVDSLGSRLPSHIVAAMISMPAMALTESAFFTSMLTHGLILAILMLWMFSKIMARDERVLIEQRIVPPDHASEQNAGAVSEHSII